MKKPKILSVRVEAQLEQELKHLALKARRTLAQLHRIILEDYVEANKPKARSAS